MTKCLITQSNTRQVQLVVMVRVLCKVRSKRLSVKLLVMVMVMVMVRVRTSDKFDFISRFEYTSVSFWQSRYC